LGAFPLEEALVITPKRINGWIGLACLPALFALANAGTASAAGEAISVKTAVTPLHGKIFKHRRVPARMRLSMQLHTPASSPKVIPLKRAVIRFPRDLTFKPNNRRTPVCTDKRLSESSNLSAGVAATVKQCPRSVIGTGTAKIYLAKVNKPTALVSDPQLVMFNAGKNKKGNAKLKIYAYSKTTNVGILMRGALNRKSVINVAVPVLSNDSATANFVLAIPGSGIKADGRKIKGRDPKYARIRCSAGKWVTRGTFTLGERTYPSGTPIGPSTVVKAAPYAKRCHGARG
jgi:hypothetical protein